MEMYVCPECWQVQLGEMPPPPVLFADHPYVTGLNQPVVKHFEWLAAYLVKKLQLAANSLVLDVGCNDGTLLDKFRNLGMRTLGIDPGKRTGELADQKQLILAKTFWNEASGTALQTLAINPDLITATAVFYHVPDLHSFIAGLKQVMRPNTTFVAQCVYLRDVLEKAQADHCYLEHSAIHSVAPLQRLFRSHGMRILDVEFHPIHGGSFLVYAGFQNHPLPTSPRVAEAVVAEKKAGLQNLDRFFAFSRQVEENRENLLALLRRIKAEAGGKTVYALSAPVKGSTLLNFAGIGPDLVKCAVEVNGWKIGRVIPGVNIPIIGEAEVHQHPDYYLVLAWNYLDYFRGKYAAYLANGGKFIVPVPTVRVI
jgi:cyclopropane fatty-acyl-phospholipid synthase-like methyltransferase